MSEAQEELKFCIMVGTTSNTSILLQENKIHYHATQDVKVEGAQKQPLEPLEQPKKQEEEGITLSDIAHAGLAVLGCIPGLGTVASLIDAGLYAVEGNGEMAAISLLAAVPGAGEAAAIAKLATKAGKIGKMAKVASNVAKGAKVAKALKYTSNVARLLVAAAVIKGLYDNRMIIKQLLAMIQKGQFDWKNPKFLLGVVTLLAQIAVMKKFKLNEGLGKAVSYERPSKFRKGVKKDTWEQAVEESEDGIVRSPGGKVIEETDEWQMGHKPGYEFRKHKASAERRGISRKEFLDEHNNPDHYRPELPEDNLGHQHEGPDDLNFWDD